MSTFNNFGTSGTGRGASTHTAFDRSGTVVSSGCIGDLNNLETLTVAGTNVSRLQLSNGTGGTDDWQFGLGSLSFSAGGVPQPSVWAFLILGFGGVGGSLRARRRAARPAVA